MRVPLSLGLLCLVLVQASVCAADGPPIVELPQYVVVDQRDLPAAEPWLYANMGGLEVVSTAAKGKTEHLLRDFQRFRQALDLVWPDVQRTNVKLGALVVCDRAHFQRFNPEADTVTLALRGPQHNALVFDLSTKTIATGEITNANDDGRIGDSYRQLYRAYLRIILSSGQPRPPAWYEEGLAQLLAAMRISDREVIVGQLDKPDEIIDPGETEGKSLALQDLDFNAAFNPQFRLRMMPFEEFLSVAHDSPIATSATGSGWNKQAYAFVHWGLYGDRGTHQKAFVIFVARLAKEPLSEELFHRTFGLTYKQMGNALISYVGATSHLIAGAEAAKGYKLPPIAPFEVRDATEAEAARIVGETLFLAGKSDAARDTMSVPYRRGDRSPDLLAALGLLELGRGEKGAARKFLELAATAKTTRGRALIELGKLRLAESLEQASTSGRRLAAAQIAAVLTPLFAARQVNARTPDLYETMAAAWEHSAIAPEPAHLSVFDEAATLFPTNAALIYRIAVLKVQVSAYADAAALVQLGLRSAPTADLKDKFIALDARLPKQN